MKQSLLHRLLLFRFFAVLKSRQPKLFYFCITLTVLQLLCTAIKLEVTPFFLYGMFSEQVSPVHNITQQKILLNGRPLEDFSLPFREQMFLETTMENYVAQKQNNETDPLRTRIENRYPFFTNLPIYPFLTNKIFNPAEALPRYEQWFLKHTGKYTGRSAPAVTVLHKNYEILPYSGNLNLRSVDTLYRF